MSSKKRPPEPRALTSGTAERLAAIVEAAEQAAAKVIDDAEEQARRQLSEAGARADRIVAERLRALADELDPQMPSRPSGAAPEAGRAARTRRLPGPARDRPARACWRPRWRSPAAAARRSSSGCSSGFDIEDTSEILDAILGPEE